MQFTWKNPTSTFKVCWNIKCVTNTTSSTNVLIRKLWQCWLGYKEVIRNFVASYVNGTTEARARHYHAKQRPAWEEAILGQKNVTHRHLVDKTKTYLPPLHMNLGLIKIYVKTMNKEGKEFDYLRQTNFSHKRGQDKRRCFRRSSSTTALSRSRLRKEIACGRQKSLERAWKHMRQLLGKSNFRKLHRNYGRGATFHLPCLGVQHVVENYISCNPTWISFFSGKYGSCLWRVRWKVLSG